MKSLRSRLPVIITRDEFEGKIQQAVDQALFDAGAYKPVPKQDPFVALRGGFDDSFFYKAEDRIQLAPQDIYVRPCTSGIREKIINGLNAIAEAFSGGWASVGQGGSLTQARDVPLEHLFLAQDAAVIKTRSDPHAAGIVKNIQFYTMGKTVAWGTPSSLVTDWLTDFRRENNMEERERNMVREIYQEGEYFWIYFMDPVSGRCKIRKIRPKEIIEIETQEEDAETKLAYHRQLDYMDRKDLWYQDIGYEEQLQFIGGGTSKNPLQPNTYVQFSRYGTSDDLRGWPPMYASLRYLKYLEDFIIDRARLHHESSKVIWFQQRKGAATRKGASGSGALNPLMAPKGGSMWIEDDTVSYRAHSPEMHSSDAEKDALLLIYAVSSANCMPMHVWNQRSDQQVYASIRKADTPFSQAILANQTFLTEEWETRDRFVLRKAVEAGALPPTVRIIQHDEDVIIQALKTINEMVVDGKSVPSIMKEAQNQLAPGMRVVNVPTGEVPISRTFPDVVQESPLDLAKVLLIHQRMKIVSDATLATRAGYDWHEELLRMVQENKQKAAIDAMREAEVNLQRAKYGLPPIVPKEGPDEKDSSDGGTAGGGRGPGSGDGDVRTAGDDMEKGKQDSADLDVTPRSSQ